MYLTLLKNTFKLILLAALLASCKSIGISKPPPAAPPVQEVQQTPEAPARAIKMVWNMAELTNVCLSFLQNIKSVPPKNPQVLVGVFYNSTAADLDTSVITTLLETLIKDSGKLDFVSGDVYRQNIMNNKSAGIDSLPINFIIDGEIVFRHSRIYLLMNLRDIVMDSVFTERYNLEYLIEYKD